MKAPCGKSCPKRNAECRKTCEEWAEYEAWKFERYKRRNAEFLKEQDYWAYHIDAITSSKKKQVKR